MMLTNWHNPSPTGSPIPNGPLSELDFSITEFADVFVVRIPDNEWTHGLSITALTPVDLVHSLAYWFGGIVFYDNDTRIDIDESIGFKAKPMSESKPEDLGKKIDIGSFGSLHHDADECLVFDTYQQSDGVSQRSIEVPSISFSLFSTGQILYHWNGVKQEGQWYGSERIRREREDKDAAMHVRASQRDARGPDEPGPLPRLCAATDHPEGCRTRARVAGFGCLVG